MEACEANAAAAKNLPPGRNVDLNCSEKIELGLAALDRAERPFATHGWMVDQSCCRATRSFQSQGSKEHIDRVHAGSVPSMNQWRSQGAKHLVQAFTYDQVELASFIQLGRFV